MAEIGQITRFQAPFCGENIDKKMP